MSFKHKGENGRVSILLVRARLHPHSLRLSPANGLSGSCFGGTNQTNLFTISSGSLNSFGPLSLGNCLHLVSQLGLRFRSVHFHVKVGFLQLETATVVLNFCVCAVLDIHGSFLTLSLPDPRVSVCLGNSNLGISLHSSCLSLTQ